MPYGDGTGPWRAQGKWRCRRPGFGRGYEVGFGPGYGRGFGRGMGRAYAYAVQEPQARESDISGLEAYAKDLEAELNEVKKRLRDIRRQDI